jgi:MoxR-like ATPase
LKTGQPDAADFGVSPVADSAEIAEAIKTVSAVRLTDEVTAYIVALVRTTRETGDFAFGASPRSAAMLATAARARAVLEGRDYVIPDDVKALAPASLRHRVILSPAAEIDGRKVDEAIASMIETIEAPR